MEREEIIEEMTAQNLWWENRELKIPEKIIERELGSKILSRINKKRIDAIIGLRRVGKTTLVKRIIKHLLKDVEAKRIFYFSFDLAQEIKPRRLIKLYSEEILAEPLAKIKDQVYFFFDEIQKVEGWENHVKSLYDKEYPIKFLVTGSSSINITKGAGESLAGRTRVYKLQPFSFREFLRYNDIKAPDPNLNNLSYPLNSDELRIAFKEYFETGGLPELYQTEIEDPKNLLDETTDLTLFRDIVNIFSVRRTKVLKGILRLIAENTAQKLNYQKLSKDLDTQYRTVKEYIQHLEDSFLIERSPPFEESLHKKLRKNPKVYISDHAYSRLWKCKKGLKAETVAFNHLKRLEDPVYNRDPEVDIVLPDKKAGFEIKYKENPSRRDAKNLLKLPETFDLFLVTREGYDEWKIGGRKIQLIPLWLLCLLI